jgi:hypothetical protein
MAEVFATARNVLVAVLALDDADEVLSRLSVEIGIDLSWP